MTVAERELSIFVSSVATLFGPKQARFLTDVWLDELACMDAMPEPTSAVWHLVTIAALARLASLFASHVFYKGAGENDGRSSEIACVLSGGPGGEQVNGHCLLTQAEEKPSPCFVKTAGELDLGSAETPKRRVGKSGTKPVSNLELVKRMVEGNSTAKRLVLPDPDWMQAAPTKTGGSCFEYFQ
jgi:hypothetical protein